MDFRAHPHDLSLMHPLFWLGLILGLAVRPCAWQGAWPGNRGGRTSLARPRPGVAEAELEALAATVAFRHLQPEFSRLFGPSPHSGPHSGAGPRPRRAPFRRARAIRQARRARAAQAIARPLQTGARAWPAGRRPAGPDPGPSAS